MKLCKLVECEKAMDKLLSYEYFSASNVYFLSSVRIRINDILESYYLAKNSLLVKYGNSTDGRNYLIEGEEKIKNYQMELVELGEQDIEDLFPPEKFFLCIGTIDRIEKEIPIEKRLGFTANDWLAIQEVIKVVETEE